MLFQRTNLLEKLRLEKEKLRKSEELILDDVRAILSKVDDDNSRIAKNLVNSQSGSQGILYFRFIGFR